jgi:hypothetical protein
MINIDAMTETERAIRIADILSTLRDDPDERLARALQDNDLRNAHRNIIH